MDKGMGADQLVIHSTWLIRLARPWSADILSELFKRISHGGI